MGACSSKKKSKSQQNESQNPYFLELINTIFLQAVSMSSTSTTSSNLNSIQYKARIFPYIKQLIDFLESNQIRIPDTLKEIYEKVKKSQDSILLITGLYLLEAVIQNINKVFLNQNNLGLVDEEDEEESEEENKGLLDIHKIDQQVLQKLTLIKSQILHVLLLYIDQKAAFIVQTYPLLVSILQHYSKFLITINYDKKINYIITYLDEVLMKYLFPMISDFICQNDSRDRTYALARHNMTIAKHIAQEQRKKEEYIDNIVTNLSEEQFVETFVTYLTILTHIELQRADYDVSSYLFKNDNQQIILQSLVWLFTKEKFSLIGTSEKPFDQFQSYLKQLIAIYQTKAQYLQVFDEFFNVLLLNFNSQLWVQEQKVTQLLSLLESNEIFIINKLIENLQNSLVLHKNYFSPPQHCHVNELNTKQFSNYLINSSQIAKKNEQSTDYKTYVQEQSTTEIEVIKTIVKCLEIFISKIENPQFAYFQLDQGVTTLLKCLILAYSTQSQSLLIQTKLTLKSLLQQFQANQFLNALKLFVIFISDHQKEKKLKFFEDDQEKIEDLDEKQQTSISVTNITLEVIIDNLNLLEKMNDEFFVEDELVVSLFQISEKEVYEPKIKIISILARIIFQFDIDMSLSRSFFQQKKVSQFSHISDESLTLFLIKYYEQGISSIQNVYTFIQIFKGLIYHDFKEFIAISMGQWILSKKGQNLDLIIMSCIQLSFCEKYTLHKEPLIVSFLGVDSVENLRKSMLNNLINFQKHLNDQLYSYLKQWFFSLKNVQIINFEEVEERYKKKVENLAKWKEENIQLVNIEEVQVNQQRAISSYTSQNYFSSRSVNRPIDLNDFDNILNVMQVNREQREKWQYNDQNFCET